jgi:hypothetical protein
MLATITGLAGRNNIGHGMGAPFDERNDVIHREALGLRSTIGTAVAKSILNGLPLFFRQIVDWGRFLPRTTTSRVNSLVFSVSKCPGVDASLHFVDMALVPLLVCKPVLFAMRGTPRGDLVTNFLFVFGGIGTLVSEACGWVLMEHTHSLSLWQTPGDIMGRNAWQQVMRLPES